MRGPIPTVGAEPAALPRLRPPSAAPLRALLALAGGVLLAGAFAPVDVWPLALLAPALLMWLWQGRSPREAARLGFLFSFGTFAAGTYWLYFSVHTLGHSPVWLAVVLMLGLAAIMGLYHAALGYCTARWLPRAGLPGWLVVVPAAWLLMEWWRGWFLSGFSWLSLGYSQTDTWFAGFAPVLGVYGISALLLVCAGALVAIVLGTRRQALVAAAVFVVPWGLGAALYWHSWTHVSGPAATVAMIQGAIPQDDKWLESHRQATLDLYESLTRRVLGTQLIVWPESAIADLANNQVPFINQVYREAHEHGSAVVMGVLRAEGGEPDTRYYNSIMALGDQVSWYDKHHLVPFAEFFPVPQFVRAWLRIMALPYSDFTRGAEYQPPLPAAHLQLGATICYEDAYGSTMLQVLPVANALVNVTNDAWFGHSSARHQHFQIVRMRALEAGRYLVRAANDGISGVVGPHGEVIARAPEFAPAVLVSRIVPMMGLTPYARVGNWPVISLAVLALAYGLWVRNDRGLRARTAGKS
ncbi:MAG: apolipoprotein N-acyltransferase [Proteobacteria bacterium]|nr:apolipoprotein N-acyltransferase [Pseudomonadota bacterium]